MFFKENETLPFLFLLWEIPMISQTIKPDLHMVVVITSTYFYLCPKEYFIASKVSSAKFSFDKLL